MSRRTLLLLVLVPILAALASGAAAAAILEVDAGSVVVAADGSCSLPEAIHNANADAQVDNGDCPAGSGADTLVLAAGSTYTFDAPDSVSDHNALPVVSSEIAIDGQGATIERDAGLGCTTNGTKDADEFRLLEVASGGIVTLTDLALRGGCADGSGTPANDGGAILFKGTSLGLTRVLVEGNTAWDKSGGLDVDGSTTTVTILDSTFRGNHGGNGAGAIGNGAGTMTIEGSTISGNTSGGEGGGGIGNPAILFLRNSTVSGNSSTGQGGGGIGSTGTIEIEHSTIVGNAVTGPLGGGGIGNAGSLEIKGSIVADNGAGGDCSNLAVFTASGQNLDTDGSCDGFTQVASVDLDLGPLAANGGPTETHALGAASVALDAVSDCTGIDGVTPIAFDQRGIARPQDGDGVGGARCDVGAYEALPGSELHLVDGSTCTLGDAIEAANLDFTVGGCVDQQVGPDTIQLEADVILDAADTARSSFLEGAHAGLPDVTSQITIVTGTGGSRIERNAAFDCDTADGPEEFRLLQVTGSGSLTLRDLVLANGCADRGGAVLAADAADLVVERVSWFDNTARSTTLVAQGGAVWIDSTGTATIEGSHFEGNLAAGSRADGGALWEYGALTSLSSSRFVGNRALAVEDGASGGSAYGGAAFVRAPEMAELVFEGNLARGADESGSDGGWADAGALFVGSGPITMSDARFVGNTARGGDGGLTGGGAQTGALETNGGTFQRVTIDSNLAQGGDGGTGRGGIAFVGGFYAYDDSLLDHVTVSGNEARGGDSAQGPGGNVEGAGLYIEPGSLSSMQHSTIAGNRAVAGSGLSGAGTAVGGGLFLYGPLEIRSSLVEGNTATVGAATVPSPCDQDDVYLTSLGFNVVAEASPGCLFDDPTDQTAAGPSLQSLGDYGCTTSLPDGSCPPTHPVAIDSPAYDQGSCTASGATADARGFSRPWNDPGVLDADDGCDAGAYESRDSDGDGVEDGFALVLVFMDGFENGGTDAWSTEVP